MRRGLFAWMGLIAVLCVSAVGERAVAHHSFAMFDQEKVVKLQGVIKEFQWTNPHSWVQLIVHGPDGVAVEWSIEGLTPNFLARKGWNRTTLKPGDSVTIAIHPLRDGKSGGALMYVILSNGTVLTQGLPGETVVVPEGQKR